jgi:hypothetical protein
MRISITQNKSYRQMIKIQKKLQHNQQNMRNKVSSKYRVNFHRQINFALIAQLLVQKVNYILITMTLTTCK